MTPAELSAARDWHARFSDALPAAVAYMSVGAWNPVTASGLAASGVYPADLAGAYFRVGPALRHTAEGAGLSFALSNGDVSVGRLAGELRRVAG